MWPVPPFGAPPESEDTLLSADELHRYDAVRLFVDRATASLPTFVLTDRNAWAEADICRRLDGLPLAIELAAVRVRGLAVELIATRLDDRFRLLTSGSRTASRQQQTLRATVDWSYELLDPAERAMFNRLSVFAGGVTLSAVEAVCADGLEPSPSFSHHPQGEEVSRVSESAVSSRQGDGSPTIEVTAALDLLLRLVDKSLVQRGDTVATGGEAQGGYELSEGEERYRLLETLREHGHEQLVTSGEAVDVHRRHLRHHLRDIEVAAQASDAARDEALRQVQRERENLRVALRRARDRADPESDRYLRDTLSRLLGRLVEPSTRQAVTPLVFELRLLRVPVYAEVEHRPLALPELESLAVGADLCWFIGDHAREASLRRRRLEHLEAAGDVRGAARGQVRYARCTICGTRPPP